MQYKDYKLLRAYYIIEKMKQSDLNYPEYLIQKFEKIRNDCEKNTKEYYKDINAEVIGDFEVPKREIYDRISEIYLLSQDQKSNLENWEIEVEGKLDLFDDYKFNKYEKSIIKNIKTFDAYMVATLLAKFRIEHKEPKEYYVYSHVSMYVISYIKWVIESAIDNQYEILYFIGEEKELLKGIAEEVTNMQNMKLDLKCIDISNSNDITIILENIKKRFAFVKYWGSDNTQELLWEDINNRIKDNINIYCYYASSVYPSLENSIKYVFSSNSNSLEFIDMIFKNVSSKTDESKEFHSILTTYLKQFYDDFDKLILLNRKNTEMQLFENALAYFKKIPEDKNIRESIGNFYILDDMGQEVLYAPAFKVKDVIERIFLRKHFKDKTMNVKMSLARSSKLINKMYKRIKRLKSNIKNVRKKICKLNKKCVSFIANIKEIVYICIYNILKVLLPIKKSKIIIASNRTNTLEGNLLWINQNLQNSDYQVKILLTNKVDFIYSIKLVANMANAKFIIIDDFFPLVYPLKIRKNAKLIQVWHAVGAFKRVGFSRMGKVGGPSEKSITHKNYTDAIVSSENIIDNYQEAFRISREKIHALGVPRTDFFFDKKKKEETIVQLYSDYPILKDKRIVLFAPTFRGNGKKTAHYPQKYIDLNRIYENLKDDEVLIIKNHPFIKENFKITEKQSEKIFDFTFYKDINQLLLITDLLITDYSSTIFEYALLNKPIIFYVPDLNKYKGSRDFYYSFDEYTYGMVCNNMDELIYSIRNTTMDEEKLQTFKEKFLNMCDGNSSKRFVDCIIREVDQ